MFRDFKLGIACFVFGLAFWKPMLAAIQLQIVSGLTAIKIQDMRSHFVLPTELIGEKRRSRKMAQNFFSAHVDFFRNMRMTGFIALPSF